ncbi:hypothetical protein HG530_004501 [Fusarium avenaceum]|nr:hypothetical protein HG530_004501 [Fusarium avenaceum]
MSSWLVHDLNTNIGLVANNDGTSSLNPALALGHDIGLASLRVVLTSARGVLEGRELVLTLNLERGELVQGQEGEDIKDELFELDAVGLLRLDGLAALEVSRGDLLAGNMVRQLASPLGNRVEETERVVVVDNVGSTESKEIGLLGVKLLSGGLVNLRVLNDVRLAVLGENQTDRLGSIALTDDLGGNVDVKGSRETDEDGISNLDKAVVNTVGVNVLDTALSHILNDTRNDKSLVETTVSVGGNSNLALGLEENLAIVGDARQDTLLEDLDVLLVQTKVVILLEELLATLGSRATKTSSLATSHEDNGDLTLGDEVQAGVVPLGDIIGTGVENASSSRLGKGLEAVGLIAGLGRVQGAGVVEGEDLLLAGLGVLLLELGESLRSRLSRGIGGLAKVKRLLNGLHCDVSVYEGRLQRMESKEELKRDGTGEGKKEEQGRTVKVGGVKS